MLISKNHLKARFTASTDKSRPVLTTIQLKVEGDEVVAVSTDAYTLSEIREQVPDVQDFPEVADITPVTEARVLAASAVDIARTMKGAKVLPILGYAHVGPDAVTTTNLTQTWEFKNQPVEGNFPDYRHLIPEQEAAKAIVTLNPKFLATMAKVFKDEDSVTLELHDKMEPVVIRADKGDHTITGVIMPMRS